MIFLIILLLIVLKRAIYIESSQSNRFYGNIINNNIFGLYTKDCSNINITNNTINTSHYQGVYLDQINGGIIKNNFIIIVFKMPYLLSPMI